RIPSRLGLAHLLHRAAAPARATVASASMSRPTHVLAIDAGTTGVRAMVVRSDGTVVARGYREFPQSFPRPGWVEHDPDDWWTALAAATTEALQVAGADGRNVAAVGITNQRETTVVWDRQTLRPIHPALVWQDRATAPRCAP